MPTPNDSANTIVIDCDGVIAGKNHNGDYSTAPPLPFGIGQVNKLYNKGYVIILYTARYGDREGGNIHMQYEKGYQEWIKWLKDNGVKYHHAFMGKPSGAMYIDDKAARVTGDDKEGWSQIWSEEDSLKDKDRYGNVISSAGEEI